MDNGASDELLETLRSGSDEDASKLVASALDKGVSPQSIWDGIFQSSGELILRQPGIISLHSATTANAIHFAYQTSGDDLTRRLLLLQGAAFLPLFRESARGRSPQLKEVNIQKLAASELKTKGDEEAIQARPRPRPFCWRTT